jgi:hypothetical protein
MQNWRLYAGLIGLAALSGTIVALALSGGPRLPTASVARASAPFPSTSTISPPVAASATLSPSTTPFPTATPSDPLARVKPLTPGWRPLEATPIVERDTGSGARLLAIPPSGAAAIPLLDLPRGTQWHLRLDGSAIAFTIDVGTTTLPRMRIAALMFQTGVASWVAPDEPFVSQRGPRWSNDGTVVYYARTSFDGLADLGVMRVRADGTNLTQLRAPTSDRAVDVVGLSPDGLTLVLQKAQAGGSLDLLDLNTRVTRSGPAGGALDAWRPNRPRALVSIGGPAVGRTSLVLWDDLAQGTATTALVTQSLVFGSDWDPTATRVVVAAALGIAGNNRPQLITMDAAGQNRLTLAGTDGASNPSWLRAGIVYLWTSGLQNPTEVRLIQPAGGTPKTLYSDTNILRLTYVSP